MERAHLSRLVVLRTVAECGSFRGAADILGIAPSAVSQAVTQLEADLGTRLLARTTRSTRPTDEGARLLARVTVALDDIAGALTETAARPETPSGPLRITMPQLAADEVIMPRLPDFVERYPKIELEIRTSDQFEDIIATGCDAGLRLGESLEADMIAIRASGPRRAVIIGSPDYFTRHPAPRNPRDLATHNCIRRRFDSGRIYRWELEKDGRPLTVDVTGNLILPQQDMIRRAALKGLGLAFLFEDVVRGDLRNGNAIAVLHDWCPPFDGYYIYYPSRRHMRPALRVFIDFFRA